MNYTQDVIDSDGARIAARDYGGSGPALVLMHGAGLDQSSLFPLVGRLRGTVRVVTFDFRGHGASARSPWTLAHAVRDLASVVAAYDLSSPVVGGHSLGGMVAVQYGLEHPACRAVINIDGHGRGRAEQYVGHSETEVRRWWETQQRRIDRLTSGPGTAALKAVLRLAGRTPTATAEAARQVVAEIETLDLFALYRQVPCPLLIFNATGQQHGPVMKIMFGRGLPLLAAYREGLRRDLLTLAQERPSTSVATISASHMLIRTHPDIVARRITEFLLDVPPVSAHA